MKRTKQLLGAVSSIALIAFTSAPALAAGTQAGQPITNEVFVDYQVGGFDQTQASGSDTFTVDRKIDLTVAETGFIGRTQVAPNQTQAVIEFEVTNLSNDVADFVLTATPAAGNDFTLTNIIIFVDADADGEYDVGEEVTYLDELAADGVQQVLVAADIPVGVTAGQTADIVLTAQAAEGGTLGAQGDIYDATNTADDTEANTEDGTVNAANIDTVLADGAGDTDAIEDGAFTDTDGYVVAAADVTVTKASTIVSDPINGTSNPKAIPGALVEYCIVVSNGPGAATATGVNVADTLPVDLEFDETFGVFINGTVDGTGDCNADGVDDANSNFVDNVSGTPDEVSATLNDLAANTVSTLYFRATIN
ncbi:hypothetical protein QWY75_05585 [Pontixanthobacter aestiaquae]|uniref:DUF11 domain-containing protein n=1 Tax=Pontixanthobacter aestiaquae TaxID=1509367 RepID=A0A844Z5X5_9SPHN|nr:hypothetical protein [Pontixanthobacter aestiaquae]MDN3645677.1 hypothetical protein [Pontixanthobacter aestiaquae]MXO83325.1 hypothetical protein [Pontixanthobacter aestiaquae]